MGRLPLRCSSCRSVSSLHLRRLVLVACWCVVAASLLQAAMAQQVRVGVILNLTSPVGQRRKVGIEMAMEDYYTANPSSRTRVVPRFRDSGGEVVGAASAGKLSPISEFRCIYMHTSTS